MKKRRVVNKDLSYNIKIEPKTENQKQYLDSLNANKITFCEGPPGVGKTYLATLKAIDGLIKEQYTKIIISRPLVQSGEDSGYLPGNINDKLDPYVRPVYDILEHVIDHETLDRWKDEKRIEIIPFGYMRGRNFFNSFIILDEVQNCSYEQLVLALTRFAKNSKMVVTGDARQSDLPELKKGGFEKIMRKLINTPDIGITYMTVDDIIREPIIKVILEKLNATDIG